jgi:succinate dehydrogenase/fumarate reductase flavoprotein subunit
MCEDIGAALVDMDKVQLHPTSFIDPKVCVYASINRFGFN